MAKTKIETNTKYYNFHPKSKKDLKRSLFNATPIRIKGKKYLGLTSWRVKWYYQTRSKAGQCKISKVNTHLTVNFTMPKLPNSYNFKHKIKSTFNSYYRKLLAHEKNHKKYAVQAAKEIDKKILSLGTYKNCTSLKKSLVRKTNRILDKYKKKNIDYDKRTKHGHTEGANISDYIR